MPSVTMTSTLTKSMPPRNVGCGWACPCAGGALRPKPADYPDCGRVFLTTRGNAFVTHTKLTRDESNPTAPPKGGARKDLIGIQFGKLLDGLCQGLLCKIKLALSSVYLTQSRRGKIGELR